MEGQKLRVLHLIDSFKIGGAQELVLSLVKGIDKERFVVDVVCLHGWGIFGEEIKLYAEKVSSLSDKKYNLSIPLALLTTIRRGAYDVLHLHLEYSTLMGSLLGFVIGRLKGIPRVVTTIHMHRSQVSALRYYAAVKLPSFAIDKYIVWCNMLYEELRAMNIGETKIARINQGVNCHVIKWDNKVSDLRKELGVSPQTAIILSVARLHKQRCLDFFIRSMRLVAEKNPWALLVLAGSGAEEQSLKALVREVGLGERVIFLGERRDLPNLYSNCDIYVTISLDEELGVAGKQAMTHAKPIVALNLGKRDKQTVLKRTKYLVATRKEDETARELLELLADPGKRRLMGLKAKHFIEENYSLEAFVRNHEAFYPALLA